MMASRKVQKPSEPFTASAKLLTVIVPAARVTPTIQRASPKLANTAMINDRDARERNVDEFMMLSLRERQVPSLAEVVRSGMIFELLARTRTASWAAKVS